MGVYSIEKLMAETRKLAAEYRRATGKTLPVSSEIAIHDAIQYLNLRVAERDDCGHDAIREREGQVELLQIKGRVIFDDNKPGHRIGQLRLDQTWDAVLLVIMDDNYETQEIYEAKRKDLVEILEETKESKRNKRGAMSVARFKIIGTLIWSRDHELTSELWQNH